jgi:hypothetical protein
MPEKEKHLLIHAQGIAKRNTEFPLVDMVERSTTEEYRYPRPWLYVGTMIDLATAHLMSAENPEETPEARMFLQDFTTYLDEKWPGKNIGRAIYHKAWQSAKELKEEITKKSNRNTVWIPQIHWENSHAQVERITVALDDYGIESLVKKLRNPNSKKYQSIQEFTKDIITNPDFFIPTSLLLRDRKLSIKLIDAGYGAEKKLGKDGKLSGEEVLKILQNIKPEGLEHSNTYKLLSFVADIQPYKYIDLYKTEGGDFDVKSLPDNLRKFIALSSARSDLVGLSPRRKNDDEAVDTIKKFKSLISGTTFGRKDLLDLVSLNTEEMQTMENFFELVRSKRIHVTVVEIKTHLVENEKFRKRLLGPLEVDKYQLKDLAHTMWSMFQGVFAIYAAQPVKDKNTQEFINLTKKFNTTEERRESLYSMMSIYNRFLSKFITKPHRICVANVYWPLFERGNLKTPWELNKGTNLKVMEYASYTKGRKIVTLPLCYKPVITDIHPRQIFRYARRYGREMALRIQEMNKQNETSHEEVASSTQPPEVQRQRLRLR